MDQQRRALVVQASQWQGCAMDDVPTEPVKMAGQADEMTQLRTYLHRQRVELRRRTQDLDADQWQQTLAPSPISPAGLVAHLAFVEDYWCVERVAGLPAPEPWAGAPWEQDWDWEWHQAAIWDQAKVWELYDAAVGRADTVLAGRSADELVATTTRDDDPLNLRWVLLHLLEEYARHLGHADLIRESIDGQTG